MASSRAILAAILAGVLAEAAAAEGLYLHRIPTEQVGGAPANAAILRIRAFVPEPTELVASLPGSRVVDDAAAEIELTAYPVLEPQVSDRHRRPSFLIDFDEPDVRKLLEILVNRHGPAPSLEALRQFTAHAIPQKSMDRGWDLASRVARDGAGDCTEHAVLLTGLARAVGLPARVVTGVVLVDGLQGGPQAYGHAWSEIHDGHRWTPVDATPIGEDGAHLAHLPLAVVGDEGPGFSLALGRQMQRGWVRRIEIHTASR